MHGYNNSYQEALYRTAQMAADVPSGGPPILFAWPSAASVLGYVADRDAAIYSRTALTAVVGAVGKSPKVKRIILLGHSMGGFLSMEAVRQLRLRGETKTLDKLQIILASPDIDVDVFQSQMLDIGTLPTPITLLVSKSDRALIVSSILAGERERVGKVDIDDPIVEAAAKANKLRVVDISSLKSVDGLGHDRFATFARIGGRLVREEVQNRKSIGNVGVFVFDAAGSAVTSPFRVAGAIIRQ
ncbi:MULTISPECIES: alpha/beta hydrolase [unclassified Rhizobium]|uniref:alpha/beta hydrolase n=1 Tax=unclassified Rhizobium TaxID=2613769 RepID=UPI00287F82E5|nr:MULTISPECIES: alpha/beta hydrolase [unclassified Rhizobium]